MRSLSFSACDRYVSLTYESREAMLSFCLSPPSLTPLCPHALPSLTRALASQHGYTNEHIFGNAELSKHTDQVRELGASMMLRSPSVSVSLSLSSHAVLCISS